EGDTACSVEQPCIDGVTGAQAQRSLPVAFKGQASRAKEIKVCPALDVGVVDIAFNAIYERSRLPVVTSMDASDEAVDIEPVTDSLRRRRELALIVVLPAPGIACMQTYIASCPD